MAPSQNKGGRVEQKPNILAPIVRPYNRVLPLAVRHTEVWTGWTMTAAVAVAPFAHRL